MQFNFKSRAMRLGSFMFRIIIKCDELLVRPTFLL